MQLGVAFRALFIPRPLRRSFCFSFLYALIGGSILSACISALGMNAVTGIGSRTTNRTMFLWKLSKDRNWLQNVHVSPNFERRNAHRINELVLPAVIIANPRRGTFATWQGRNPSARLTTCVLVGRRNCVMNSRLMLSPKGWAISPTREQTLPLDNRKSFPAGRIGWCAERHKGWCAW